ncbi:hypothetical protein [Photobacterium kasasachensis]|uniref:hypothetical protein n=1 Tax=Photobacterium kasasachensis TaxID=2910240 RepID=UPI003D132AC1
MNSVEIEKVLLALGFVEKPNSIKSIRLEHHKLDYPVYIKNRVAIQKSIMSKKSLW